MDPDQHYTPNPYSTGLIPSLAKFVPKYPPQSRSFSKSAKSPCCCKVLLWEIQFRNGSLTFVVLPAIHNRIYNLYLKRKGLGRYDLPLHSPAALHPKHLGHRNLGYQGQLTRFAVHSLKPPRGLSCGDVESCLVDKDMNFGLTFPNHFALGIY